MLSTDKAEEATAAIEAINDPSAVNALVKYLDSDLDRRTRMLCIAALARINDR